MVKRFSVEIFGLDGHGLDIEGDLVFAFFHHFPLVVGVGGINHVGGCDAVFRYFHIGGRRAIERRGKVLFSASLHGAEAESAGPGVFTVDTVDRSKLRGIVEAPASGGGVTDHVERSYDSGAFEIFGVECHVGRIESKAIFAGFYDFPLVVGVGGEYHRVVGHPVLGYLAVGRCRTIEGRGEIFCTQAFIVPSLRTPSHT